jgi:hypothetical protein
VRDERFPAHELVSIHAPPWGATCGALHHQALPYRFNPRAHAGGVQTILRTMLKPEWFQSTRQRVVRPVSDGLGFSVLFQSMRPFPGGITQRIPVPDTRFNPSARWRAILPSSPARHLMLLQSHAGSNRMGSIRRSSRKCFNPRCPTRGRPQEQSFFACCCMLQSTSPSWGSPCVAECVTSPRDVALHTPTRGTTSG